MKHPNGGTLVGESDSRPETIVNAGELNKRLMQAIIQLEQPSPEEQAAQWKKIFEDEINTLKGRQH